MTFLKRLQDNAGISCTVNELRNLADQQQTSLFDLKTEAARFETLMAVAREKEASNQALLEHQRAQIDGLTISLHRESSRAVELERVRAEADTAHQAVALENGQLLQALLEARQLAADANAQLVALKAQLLRDEALQACRVEATGEAVRQVNAQTGELESKLRSLEEHHEAVVRELELQLLAAHDTMQRFAVSNEEMALDVDVLKSQLASMREVSEAHVSQAAAAAAKELALVRHECQSTIRELETKLEQAEETRANESELQTQLERLHSTERLLQDADEVCLKRK